MTRYTLTKIGVLGAVLLAAELTVLETWSWRGAKAEALLALACFAALFARDSRQGLLAAWLIGLLKDVGSSGPLGLHAALFLGAGWGVLQVRQVLFRENALTQVAVAFVSACWVNAACALFVAATAGGVPWGTILGKTLVSAAFTAALTPFLLLVLLQVKWLVR